MLGPGTQVLQRSPIYATCTRRLNTATFFARGEGKKFEAPNYADTI